MTREALLAFVAMAGAVLVACGSGDALPGETATPSESINEETITEDDWYECKLSGGGPASSQELDARCATWSEQLDGRRHVIDAYEWRCDEFAGDVRGFEPCTDEFGRFFREYFIEEDGTETGVVRRGQFPPFLAE
jgi:hypothetical protein